MEGEHRPVERGTGSFNVHRGHAFEGFDLTGGLVRARCACGVVLDVAEPAFAECPDCTGPRCSRCGGTGAVVDHAALAWRLPLET